MEVLTVITVLLIKVISKNGRRRINRSARAFEHYRFKADPGQSLLRIDKFLSDRLENSSRTRIQNAANAGNILVNNNAVKPNYRIKPGDIVQVVLPTPPREIELIPEIFL